MISRGLITTTTEEEGSSHGRCRAAILGFLFVVTPTFGVSARPSFASKAEAAKPALVQVDRVENIDEPAKEPSIVEHPDGTLFVSGYGKSLGGTREVPDQKVPRLCKSSDHGKTWTRVNVGTEADGAIGNSDVSLAVAQDGTLYFASMGFDVKVLEGTHIAIGVSNDVGKTWRWTMLSKKRFDDRPWVAVAPDGTAHVIWNDGSGVYHTVSRNRGVTWSEPHRIHPDGGSSHLAVGPEGEVAVHISPESASGNKFTEGVDLIAVSIDGGLTWQKRPSPGQHDWAPGGTQGAIPRWVEPLAWDSQGTLYSLWTNVKGVWLAQSLDRGATWRSYRVADIDDLSYFPYLAARGPGELAATWFSGAGEALRWHACKIQLSPGMDHPRVIESYPLTTDTLSMSDHPDNAPVRDAAGEYLSVTFLRDGDIAVVSPIQDPPAKRYGFTFWRFKGN